MSERIAAVLDQARAVLYDPDGYVLAWFGGHGVHVYRIEDGLEVSYWTVGDFAREQITPDEAFESMREHVADWLDVFGWLADVPGPSLSR